MKVCIKLCTEPWQVGCASRCCSVVQDEKRKFARSKTKHGEVRVCVSLCKRRKSSGDSGGGVRVFVRVRVCSTCGCGIRDGSCGNSGGKDAVV